MLGILLQVVTNVADTAAKTVNQVVNTPVAEKPVESISFLDLLEKGGVIMIPIALLSIIAIYVFIERYFSIRKATREESNFMNSIREFILAGKVDSALALCKSTNKPIASMIKKGIMRIGRPLKEIEEAIEIIGKFEVYKLERNLVILSICAGVAPMLGFVGTIIGVIKIFHDISLSGDVSINSVSAGLYTKMVSSAAGLIVGVISFIFYHWLNIMIEKAVQKMEHAAVEFMDLLQEPTK
ncbi:MAG TPA: MotA/TolQ/ExbB proton channel family protein [Bacteroidales bacterium]|nr:MotA/TolQ/ExbB proton channel family protein [Bacteroidales bacterium]HPS16971.1 MotA/TolQ/ExbB proton channel family protein [Bacteroidales bacterium]